MQESFEKLNQIIVNLAQRFNLPELDSLYYPSKEHFLLDSINPIVWQECKNDSTYIEASIVTLPSTMLLRLPKISDLFNFLGLVFTGEQENNNLMVRLHKSSMTHLLNPENEKLNYREWMEKVTSGEQEGTEKYKYYFELYECHQAISTEFKEIKSEGCYSILRRAGNAYNALSLLFRTKKVESIINIVSNLSHYYYISAIFHYISALKMGDFFNKEDKNYQRDRMKIKVLLATLIKGGSKYIIPNLIRLTEGENCLKERVQYFRLLTEVSSEKPYQRYYNFFLSIKLAKKNIEKQNINEVNKFYDQALTQLSFIEGVNGWFVDFLYVWACTLYQQKIYKKTINYCDKILKIEKDNRSTLFLKAKSLFNEGNSKEAERILHGLLKYEPPVYFFESYFWLAEIAVKNKHYQGAIDYFIKARNYLNKTLVEIDSEVCYRLALCCAYLGKYKESLVFYKEASFFPSSQNIIYVWLLYSIFKSKQDLNKIYEEYKVGHLIQKTVEYATRDVESLRKVIDILQPQEERHIFLEFYDQLLRTLSNALLDKFENQKLTEGAIKQLFVVLYQKIVRKDLKLENITFYRTLINILPKIFPDFLKIDEAVRFCVKSVQDVPEAFDIILKTDFSPVFYYKLGNQFKEPDKKITFYKKAKERNGLNDSKIGEDLSNQLLLLSYEEITDLDRAIELAIKKPAICKELVVTIKNQINTNTCKVLSLLAEKLPPKSPLRVDVNNLLLQSFFKQGQYKEGFEYLFKHPKINIPQDQNIDRYRELIVYFLTQNSDIYKNLLLALGDLLEKKEPKDLVSKFCLDCLKENISLMLSVIKLFEGISCNREEKISFMYEMFFQIPKKQQKEFIIKTKEQLSLRDHTILAKLFNKIGKNTFESANETKKNQNNIQRQEACNKALEFFKYAEIFDPKYPPVLYNMGVVLFKNEEKKPAEICFRSTLSLLKKSKWKGNIFDVISPLFHRIEIPEIWENEDIEDRLYKLTLGLLKKYYKENPPSFWKKSRIPIMEIENKVFSCEC